MTSPLPLDVPARPGHVSRVCRYQDEGGIRFVLVREIVVASYDLRDQNAQRTIWVQLHRAGHATQGQIALALGVGLRTVNGWVRRYRQEGVRGLMNQPLRGKQADEEKAALIRQYRAAGKKITQIVVLVNVCRATVNRVLGRDRANGQKTLELSPINSATDRPVKTEVLAAPAPVAVPAPNELSSTTAGVDPLDRSGDRALARLGLLEDAPPVFAPGENLPWVGVFLALALLGQEPLLPVAQKCFGPLGAAFYGLRTTLVTLLMLALLRIKRPEQLRGYDAVGLGRMLGLDRAPEVKTLRRKLHEVSQQDRAMPFLEALAQARVRGLKSPPRVVYLDGHVSVYSGQYKIGEVYSTRDKQVVKGTTQTWVNLPGRAPLFCVTSEFNEGLAGVLPAMVQKAAAICGSASVLSVFDRGGHSGLGFEKLRQAGHHFLTYRRGRVEPWPLARFAKTPTLIGERLYAYAPAEQAVEIPVYEAGPAASGQRGAPRKVDTGRRVAAREIRVVRPDGGQTSVLISDPDRSAVEACAVMFGRWGAQENIFKYLLAEYDLDATVEYGQEELNSTITHPHPEYVRVQKQIAARVARRNQQLGKLGVPLLAEPVQQEHLQKTILAWTGKPAGKKALARQREIEALRTQLAALPPRVAAKTSGFHRLRTEMKLLTIGVKLSAYYLETKLVDLLAPFYPNHAKEGRKLIVAALKSPGSIRLQPGQIRVQLARQSSPCRTRAIAKLCETLNLLQPVYPGTQLHIVFDSPVH
jgi:transposase